MSQVSIEADPVRRRAGLLSALVKLYVNAKTLIDKDGSAEEALQLQEKLQVRYDVYVESHEIALVTYPDREESLTASHIRNEERHQQLLSDLQAYIADGTKPDDLQSLHAASLFSRHSSTRSKAASSKCTAVSASRGSQANSDRLSESRVQAELAKRKFAQQQAEQLKEQQRIDFERDIARQKRELDQRKRALQEEAELRKRELDNAQKLQKQKDEMNNLQAEVQLREKVQIRADRGNNSDLETESDRCDVTRFIKSAPKHKIPPETFSGRRNPVKDWLSNPANDMTSSAIRVTNTPQIEKLGNVPAVTNSRPNGYSGVSHEKPNSHRQEPSDAALFRRALLENRMPAPKQMEFDGNPRTFLAFLASFKTNIERKLTDNDDDAALKLTYLLQHCVGDAKYLIDDCAMLEPREGFETAMERLRESYGKGHVIARSYIESVTTGPPIKMYDFKALVKLKNDMVKCQSVLSLLKFSSDLDCTETLKSIVKRLPDCFHVKWTRRAVKILDGGRSVRFSDLVEFVRKEANIYSSQFGQLYCEEHVGEDD